MSMTFYFCPECLQKLDPPVVYDSDAATFRAEQIVAADIDGYVARYIELNEDDAPTNEKCAQVAVATLLRLGWRPPLQESP